MAKEILEVDIRVEDVSKFKSDLNQAKVALNKLQSKELEAGGASDVLKNKIAAQRIEVRRLRLAHEGAALALKRHEIQALKTGTAVTKLGKKQKKSNMAMTQAAYAIDDMQYGFQGVQNNIQAMAVSMGASGPLVIGLTLVTVAIGFVIKHFVKMGKEAKEAADLSSKAIADSQGPIVKLNMYADAVKNSETNTYEFKNAMVELKKMGFDPVNGSIDTFVEKKTAMIKLNAIESATVAAVSKKLAEQLKLQAELTSEEEKLANFKKHLKKKDGILIKNQQKDVDDLREKVEALKLASDKLIATGKKAARELIEDAGLTSKDVKDPKKKVVTPKVDKPLTADQKAKNYYRSINKDIKETLELMRAEKATKEELIQKEMQLLEASNMGRLRLEDQEGVMHRIKVLKAEMSNMPGVKLLDDKGVGLTPDDNLFEKFKSDLAIIRQLFDEGTISFDEWIRRVENLTTSFAKIDQATNTTAEQTEVFAGAFIGAFESAATQGGNFMENLARGLMSSLGSILIQQGTAAIFSGIAKNGIVPGSGVASIKSGAIVVGAGIALKAGSSIGKRSAGAGGGGGGGSGGKSKGTTVARPNNPVRENARVRNSNLIIPLDKMRYGNQVANDNYSGFN